MTLEETIEQEKLQIEENREKLAYAVTLDNQHAFDTCMQNIEEHEQLAEWLEELKFLRRWKSDVMDSFCKYDVSSFEELVTNTRNKTIDDFVKEICKMIVQSENNGNYRFYAVEIKQAIADLAEQLKVGGKNDGAGKCKKTDSY